MLVRFTAKKYSLEDTQNDKNKGREKERILDNCECRGEVDGPRWKSCGVEEHERKEKDILHKICNSSYPYLHQKKKSKNQHKANKEKKIKF